jgi:glycosyltransferase involved in cell wall biosynthesis
VKHAEPTAVFVPNPPARLPERVGFISTRFAGTDGVTLEAFKWASIIEGFGGKSFWMGGQMETPPETTLAEPLAFFRHPEVEKLHARLFGVNHRSRAITNEINGMKEHLKDAIYRFLEKFGIELVVPQNILAIPMHIPLGLAMTEVLAETGLPAIAHHHDFSWERERFTVNSVSDYLQAAFPPSLPRVEHVVINSMAQKELARRFGLPSTLIPNILDFETPPPGVDDYNGDLRREFGLKDDDWLILQPTRLVARKGIEHSIDLIRQMNHPKAKLVLSHPAGDEGDEYMSLLHERIQDAGIEAIFISDRIAEKRGKDERGRKLYTLFDVYPHADLITYPSTYEGFGNAFLEAIYFGKPVLVNRYAVYARDIDPLGFRTISMSGIVTRAVVKEALHILNNDKTRREWAAINYELALKYFSYSMARRKLLARLASLFGES